MAAAVFACWLLETATAFASVELRFPSTTAAPLPAAFGSTERPQSNVQRDIGPTQYSSTKSSAMPRWRRPRSIALPPIDEEEDWDEPPPLFLSAAVVEVEDVKPPSSLLPQLSWDPNIVIAQSFAQTKERPILLFDGACNLCNDWVNFCLDYDPNGTFFFASLQSKVGQSILVRDGRSPDDRSNIILATPAETYANSEAALRVVSQLDGLPILLRVAATLTRFFLPQWFRDVVYKVFAANRHAFGDTDGPVCRLDLDGEFIGRFLEDPELDFLDENLASESEAEVFLERRR
jgi:predicted DCC family thiol-disulfide oxidoreductase YuxK